MGAESSTLVESSSARAVAPATDAQAAADTVEIAWKEATHSAVSPRVTQGAAIADGAKAVVVCGHDLEAEYADAWLLDGEGGAWKAIDAGGRGPRARGGHTVIAVPGVGVVVFGGISHEKGGYLSDVAVLAPPADGGAAWAWTPVCATGELPCGRDKHSAIAVPDGSSGTMIVLADSGSSRATMTTTTTMRRRRRTARARATSRTGRRATMARRAARPSTWAGSMTRTASTSRPSTGEATPIRSRRGVARATPDGGGRLRQRRVGGRVGEARAQVRRRRRRRRSQGTVRARGARVLPPRRRHAPLWRSDARGSRQRHVGARRRRRRRRRAAAVAQAEAAGTPPSARSFHSITALPCTADGADRRAPTMAALFGGLDADGRHLADLHLFTCAAHAGGCSWTRVRQASAFAPSPRASAFLTALVAPAGAHESVGRAVRLVVFGGSSEPGEMGDSCFHGDTHTADLQPLLDAVAAAKGTGAATTIEEEEAAAREEAQTAEQPSKKAKRVDEHGAAARPIDGAPPAVLPPTSTTTTTTTAAAAAAAPVVFDFATMAPPPPQ